MSNHTAIVAQALDLLQRKHLNLNAADLAFLAEQAKRIFNEFKSMGMNVNGNLIAAKLDGVVRSRREQSSSTATTANRLSRSSTGEKLPSRSISRSTSDGELVYSFQNPKSQKIRVNVIRDEIPSPRPTVPKMKTHRKKSALIGSKTIEDLLKVANQSVSSSSKVDRVIIIDRPKTKSPKQEAKKRPATPKTYEVRSGLVSAPSMIQPSNFYSSQPQWFLINPYASNPSNFYQPFVYYSY